MEPTPSTFHSIQVLRVLAALLVVLFHSHTAVSEAGADPLFRQERYLFEFGAVGVHIFFVISGFIMVATSNFEPVFRPRQFMRRRLVRIYPVYWICAALYLAYHSLYGEPYELSFVQLVSALLLWPGHAGLIIGPAWTLAYEMFFYCCFALAMALGLTRGLVVLSGSFAVLIVFGLVVAPVSPALHLATNALLAEFVAGMAIGWLLKRNFLPMTSAVPWITMALVLYVGGLFYGFSRLPSALAWGLPSAFLVLGAICWELRQGTTTITRWTGVLGDSSYSLYLVHILLITLFLEVTMEFPPLKGHSALAMTAIVTGSCVVLAELFHRGVERPLLRRLNPRRGPSPPRLSRKGANPAGDQAAPSQPD
jgi:exopolysaccharide production protein ExoZ